MPAKGAGVGPPGPGAGTVLGPDDPTAGPAAWGWHFPDISWQRQVGQLASGSLGTYFLDINLIYGKYQAIAATALGAGL